MKKLVNDFLRDFIKQVNDIKRGNVKEQIPNILTFSRALSPFIIIPLLIFEKYMLTVIVLMIFALTDFLDGKIARKNNLVSNFGKKLDACCDKVFAISLIIPAILKFKLLIFSLLLELSISFVNLYSASRGMMPKSSTLGKIKTWCLSITLVLVYLPEFNSNIIFFSLALTLLFQIATFINYIFINLLKAKKK